MSMYVWTDGWMHVFKVCTCMYVSKYLSVYNYTYTYQSLYILLLYTTISINMFNKGGGLEV